MTVTADTIPPDVLEQARAGLRDGFVWPVLPLKQLLRKRASAEESFAIFRALVELPADRSLARKRIRSLVDHARAQAAFFRQASTPGRAFVNHPPRVIGDGDQRALHGKTRTGYVAQLRDVCVRGRSSLIDAWSRWPRASRSSSRREGSSRRTA